ncbi:MAG: Ref family recombination enhancement nuclease [Candidatus Paceibacterota bacterium]|jgi:hypothetical protein
MNPTIAEKKFHDDLAEIVGCIACRLDGQINHYVSIHHIDGRTKPGSHKKVLPLCAPHHQTGGEEAPAIHPWKRRFIAKYGTQEELLATCHAIIALVKELEKI